MKNYAKLLLLILFVLPGCLDDPDPDPDLPDPNQSYFIIDN